MGHQTFTRAAYDATAAAARAAGSATFRGEERRRQGLGLDPLVDPAGNGLIRRSLARKDRLPSGLWQLTVGTPILTETLLDTTGSMGKNVQYALSALPDMYDLLKSGQGAVLRRYDLQCITSIFGDERDTYVLNRSHAEMGGKIADQMTMMVPEGGGAGNGKEDPQYGLFAAAYLTDADTNRYGLRTYHCTISDEPIGTVIDEATLRRIFGDTVFEKVAENGYPSITAKNLPSLEQVVADLKERAHTFFLMVNNRPGVLAQWTALYGAAHVVPISNVRLLPYVQAAIIGLTEGVLKLGAVTEFLIKNKVDKDEARRIARSVASVPIGAQAALPNFDRIPMAGALFKEKTDLWPIAAEEAEAILAAAPATTKEAVEWL